ncbi:MULTISPECIES: BatD family protein [Vibrio]|uniref:BatD family protein n=1 Tax=Vibrio TaxID=662 RepID=UPI000B5C6EE2|nr:MULTISPECIES: BatD family protein [Vibrio]HBV76056.1 hypothetical protein [Vibrio sp.]
MRYFFTMACIIWTFSPPAYSVEMVDNSHNTLGVKIYSWVGAKHDIASYQYDQNFVPINKSNNKEKPLSAKAEEKGTLPTPTAEWMVNEPAAWHIVIAVPTWFTKGTQIPKLNIPNLITTQRALTPNKMSNRVNGQTWTYQLWDIPLFMTQDGLYHIPSMPIDVHVADPKGGEPHTIRLWTKEEWVGVKYPTEQLSSSSHWIAAPKASLNEDWQVSQSSLHVGDSITRTITLRAQDTLAVMLPNPSDVILNEAYQAYVSPSQKQDSQDRGIFSASRIEKTTYVLQKGGELTFPAVGVPWWNTQSQSLELLHLPQKTFEVKHTLKSWLQYYAVYLIAVFVFVFSFGVILWQGVRYYHTHPLPEWACFYRALWYKNWPMCRTFLYRRLREKTQQVALMDYDIDSIWQKRVKKALSDQSDRSTMLWLWRRIKRQPYSQTLKYEYQAIPALNRIRINKNHKLL